MKIRLFSCGLRLAVGIVLLLTLMPGAVAMGAGTWQYVGAPGFSAGEAYLTELVMDHGTPYIAYRDDANGHKATVMRFDGTTWLPVGSPGISMGEVGSPSLAVEHGTPYVAFYDGGYSYRTSVMKFDGAAWVTLGTPGALNSGASSLALNQGTPYVAYADWDYGGRGAVAKFDGAGWVLVGQPAFSVARMANPTLAFDQGSAYLAYADMGLDQKAVVMKFNGVSWAPLGTPGFSAGMVEPISMAVHNGTPYVAYEDWAYGSRATVMKFDGTNWTPVGMPGFSSGWAEFITIALDGDTPYVAFRDSNAVSKATVMKFDGTNWIAVGSPGFTPGGVNFTSLAIDGSTPYLAYMDASHANRATVMKFAEPAGDSTPPVIIPNVQGTLGLNGWYITEVHLSWVISDAESAISATNGCEARTISVDQADTTYTCIASSAGGTNSASVTIRRDASAPRVTVEGVEANQRYLLGAVPPVSCITSDDPAGVASAAQLTISGGNEQGVGVFTATCSGAMDLAGNTAAPVSVEYTVGYAFGGFRSPVEIPPGFNRARAGQAVPLKWRVMDAAGKPVTNLAQVGVRLVRLDCATQKPLEAVQEQPGSPAGLQYLGDGFYLWLWKTSPGLAHSCQQLSLDLGEGPGGEHLLWFLFK